MLVILMICVLQHGMLIVLAKSDTNWFTDYAKAFQLSGILLGYTAEQASAYARNFADTNVAPILGVPGMGILTPNVNGADPNSPRFEPGSYQFNQALKTVASNADLTQGAKFIDKSRLLHSDVNYNLKDVIKVAEIQVGGSWRQYRMDSQGTIFTDFDGPLRYTEYGAYTQVQKKLMDDRLKLTGSVRYDKSQNFDGNVSPRASVTYAAGANKQHNFRASYQTGFRNPTTQDQYIGLDLGPFALIGSAPDNLARFTEVRNVSATGQTLYGQPATIPLDGEDAYQRSYTLSSVQAMAASGNPADLKVATIGLVKPEQVQAIEVGYRTIYGKLGVDLSGYYNMYQDFINTKNVITPYYGFGTPLAAGAIAAGDRRVYQVYTNSTADVTSLGAGIGLNYKLGKFDVGASYNYSEFKFVQESDPDFEAGF